MFDKIYKALVAIALAVILFNAAIDLRDRFSGCTTDSECERIADIREGAQK